MASHFTLDRKVRVYQRPESSKWHCETRLAGRKLRKSTGETNLGKAKKVAEDCYFDVRSGEINASPIAQKPEALIINGHSFREAAFRFEEEYEVLTEGQRNPRYARDHSARLRNHLLPFFGKLAVTDITTGHIQDYQLSRMRRKSGKRTPSKSTMHHEIITLRHVVKTALKRGWIDHLPDFSAPYGQSRKVSHRAWFSPDEYKRLYTATRARIKKRKVNGMNMPHNSYMTTLCSWQTAV